MSGYGHWLLSIGFRECLLRLQTKSSYTYYCLGCCEDPMSQLGWQVNSNIRVQWWQSIPAIKANLETRKGQHGWKGLEKKARHNVIGYKRPSKLTFLPFSLASSLPLISTASHRNSLTILSIINIHPLFTLLARQIRKSFVIIRLFSKHFQSRNAAPAQLSLGWAPSKPLYIYQNAVLSGFWGSSTRIEFTSTSQPSMACITQSVKRNPVGRHQPKSRTFPKWLPTITREFHSELWLTNACPPLFHDCQHLLDPDLGFSGLAHTGSRSTAYRPDNSRHITVRYFRSNGAGQTFHGSKRQGRWIAVPWCHVRYGWIVVNIVRTRTVSMLSVIACGRCQLGNKGSHTFSNSFIVF